MHSYIAHYDTVPDAIDAYRLLKPCTRKRGLTTATQWQKIYAQVFELHRQLCIMADEYHGNAQALVHTHPDKAAQQEQSLKRQLTILLTRYDIGIGYGEDGYTNYLYSLNCMANHHIAHTTRHYLPLLAKA